MTQPTSPSVDGETLTISVIAPSKCSCCDGDLEITGVSYSCDKQSTEYFHIDDMASECIGIDLRKG